MMNGVRSNVPTLLMIVVLVGAVVFVARQKNIAEAGPASRSRGATSRSRGFRDAIVRATDRSRRATTKIAHAGAHGTGEAPGRLSADRRRLRPAGLQHPRDRT